MMPNILFVNPLQYYYSFGIGKIDSQEGSTFTNNPQETVLAIATIAAVSIAMYAAISCCCEKKQVINEYNQYNQYNECNHYLRASGKQETQPVLEGRETQPPVETKEKRFSKLKKWLKKPLEDKIEDLRIIMGVISVAAKFLKKRIKPLIKR